MRDSMGPWKRIPQQESAMGWISYWASGLGLHSELDFTLWHLCVNNARPHSRCNFLNLHEFAAQHT